MTPGALVAGRFEIDREIAAGGMGRVFLARDRHDGAKVALKVMLTRGDDADARFERERVALAEIVHPAVVRHVAHGSMGDGAPYLVTEWLDGIDRPRGSALG